MNAARFEGKVALVTGGNSGIGLAVAQALVAEGARVVIVGRNAKTVDAVVADLGSSAHGVVADTSRLADIDRVIAETKAFGGGRLDVVFANAGVATFGPIATIDEAKWDELMGINLKGVYFTVQKALPLMRAGGAIVLNASVAAGQGRPGRLALCGEQGRRALARAQPGRRVGGAGDPRQRREPGADRDAAVPARRHGCRVRSEAQGRMERAQSDEALRPAGGSGGDGALPRLGRGLVHDGGGSAGRWRAGEFLSRCE